jgi:hypothetical protein
VSADALMQQSGAVQLIGRASTQHSFGPAGIDEYYLQLSNAGAWSLVRNNTSDALTTLASGTVAAPGTSTWQHLALTSTAPSFRRPSTGPPSRPSRTPHTLREWSDLARLAIRRTSSTTCLSP